MRVALRCTGLSVVSLLLVLMTAHRATSQCNCPSQGDIDGDGFLTAFDLPKFLEILMLNSPDVQDPQCPATRSDFNADGFVDMADEGLLMENLFFGGANPEDPCACGYPCPRSLAAGTGNVFVESKTVDSEEQSSVGIYLTNSSELTGIVIPLMVRAIDNYPSALSASKRSDSRLQGHLGNGGIYELDIMNGACAGGPGTGFGTVGSVGPSSPDAFRFSFLDPLSPSLPAGSDISVPSLEISFTAPTTPGTFEIDTTCTNPDQHLAFFETGNFGEVVPSFVKGIITVDCDCPNQGNLVVTSESPVIDPLDLNALIDVLFFSAVDPQDPHCPRTRGDFNNDRLSDPVDLNLMIDYLFFSGEMPCDPCDPVQATCTI